MGTYKGHARFGVSVFDFKVGRARLKNDNEAGPMFVGYARPLRGCAARNLSI